MRADATPAIGAGHVMRCATLMRAWQAAGLGEARLEGRVELAFVADRLRTLGLSWGAPVTGSHVAVRVVDSYDNAVRRSSASEPASSRVLVDDLGCEVPAGYAAVWHPHPAGAAGLYPGYAGTVISGPASVAIRENLPRWAATDTTPEIAVTLGGAIAEPDIVDALAAMSALMPEARFVTTGGTPTAQWRSVAPEGMWQQLVRCRALLTASGGTVWEAAHVRIPTVVFQIADNQVRVARWAGESGAPVVRRGAVPAQVANDLAAGIAGAAVLPFLADGAPAVARHLAALAAAA